MLTEPTLRLAFYLSSREALTDQAQSAVMAGLKVVSVQVHPDGNLDLADLQAKAEKHKDKLAAFMVYFDRFIDSYISETRYR